jgi:Rrf2 family protein
VDLRPLLKREESYALHALINVAENPGTKAAMIADQLSMPPAFMAKVMRKLTVAGLIDSRTGRGGGVEIKVDPASVSVLDVVEVISGTVVLDVCQTLPRCATQRRKGHCNLKLATIAASAAIREALAGIRLADLCDPVEGVETGA